MKKEIMLRQSLLAGVLAIALTGCVAASDEDISTQFVVPEEDFIDTAVIEEEAESLLENAEKEESVCEPETEDCIVSEDYLTNRFVQMGDENVVSLSRPAGLKGVSVKDKNAEKNPLPPLTEEKILYTTIAIPEVVDGDEKLVSEKTNETIVTTIQKNGNEEQDNITAVSKVDAEEPNLSELEPMIPLKKVKTTITETTTRVEKEKPPRKEWSNKMTLAERVEYGQEEQEWDAKSGSTLRQLLRDWGNKAGWTVVWKLDRDYNLEAGVIFTGTFTEVSSALIRSFARATPAPIGTFYQGNRVLVVNTQEDENER